MNWFSVTLISYGTSFSVGNLEGTIFTNGYFYSVVNLGNLRPCFSSLRQETEFGCLVLDWRTRLSSLLPTQFSGNWSYLHLPLTSTIESISAFKLSYVVTAESFPTEYRGTVFRLANFIARVGGIFSPLIGKAASHSFMYLFGALSLVYGVLSSLLK